MQSDIERKWDFQKQFLFLCDCMNFLHRVSLNWTDLIPWKMDQLMYFIVIYRSALQCNEIQEDTEQNNFYFIDDPIANCYTVLLSLFLLLIMFKLGSTLPFTCFLVTFSSSETLGRHQPGWCSRDGSWSKVKRCVT